MLDVMKAWLETYPQWEGTLQFDYADSVPGNAGLYPRGITELSRRESSVMPLGYRPVLPGSESA